MLTRHSSRRRPLDAGFLTPRLTGARSYDRIAGYFSSSILEVAGEALESVQGNIRVVCNSRLSRADVEAAKAARAAMRREWCDSRPEDLGDGARSRFRRLHDLLRSGKVEVRVLPDDAFGLIHGKAGVITGADGARTSFLGSANESGVEHPGAGAESIRRCPRRVGIVSTGLVTAATEAAARLAEMRFECVILDEAHRARRRNLSSGPQAFAAAQPNNLLKFITFTGPNRSWFWRIRSRSRRRSSL